MTERLVYVWISSGTKADYYVNSMAPNEWIEVPLVSEAEYDGEKYYLYRATLKVSNNVSLLFKTVHVDLSSSRYLICNSVGITFILDEV